MNKKNACMQLSCALSCLLDVNADFVAIYVNERERERVSEGE